MLPKELSNLKLIPANDLRDGFEQIPPDPGVYLFFVRDGDKLLEETAYFKTDDHHPLEARGWQHLYTGGATNLRYRVSQHFLSINHESSSPRKTLLALEYLFGAVSKAIDSGITIEDNESLSDWMFENILVGYEKTAQPFARESHLIHRYGSPFNIAHRRRHPYSNMAASICSAFLAAAGLLIPNNQSRSAATVIKAVRATKASITALRFGTNCPNLVLTVVTLAGPKLCFEIPLAAGEGLAQSLTTTLLGSVKLFGTTH